MAPSLECVRELLFGPGDLEQDVDEVDPRGQHDVEVVELRLALRPHSEQVERVQDAGVEVQGGVAHLPINSAQLRTAQPSQRSLT